MRLIDADALLEKAEMREHKLNGLRSAVYMCVAKWDIENAPTIEAEPVRHGKWEHLAYNTFRCTACERASYVETVVGFPSYEYCPYCGAKMKEAE